MIEQEQESISIRHACRALAVSVSGYYAWRGRPESAHTVADRQLSERITQLFFANRQVYGTPRVWEELKAEGIAISPKRVARLLREAGLSAVVKRKRTVTTKSDATHPVAPNLLARNFAADKPNAKWCGDITYIGTDTGWLYLAVIIDLFSRRVVGWATSNSLASPLVEAALERAVADRQPGEKLLHHSDRGSQYTGQPYQTSLSKAEMIVSMSAKGDCLDNAVAESFFATLKNECVYRAHYRNRQEAHRDIFDYIESFYNRKRRHSTLGYLSSMEFENKHQVCLN